ncbi:carboxypeptidase-like regulatory domain-containing protein [Fulvivirga sp. 29W222]|uniref:Carboxypeptidase-like regulatory domain-containing protein n=1 Tax=Fulvivirga marina TaxID=2494733 RepID=A0A937FYF7_9BACT|nr:carboxypeptidase-like regulatory domain-containing protein [Fulvivirga marina]MBL6447307.1 carboxypeptidase-like regulatory domain-containing protein [Fulvivirga marina]
MNIKKYCSALIFVLSLFIGFSSSGQKKTSKPVRISGVVLDADDRKEVPYVSIRIAGTMYGTAADNNGYFSLFINPGDTLLFTSIGYRDATFVMPYDLNSEQYSLVQLMRKETVMLSEVVVFPWPDIKTFESAFLDVKPKRNMDDLVFEVQRDIKKTVKDNEEYEYYSDQMRYNRLYELHGVIPPNNFLNPIRWVNFIRDVKQGKFEEKKKDK